MKLRLVPEWRLWYRLHSVQLAIGAGVVAGVIGKHPDEVKAVIDALGLSPNQAAFLAWLLVTAIPTGLRLLCQPGIVPPPSTTGDPK